LQTGSTVRCGSELNPTEKYGSHHDEVVERSHQRYLEESTHPALVEDPAGAALYAPSKIIATTRFCRQRVITGPKNRKPANGRRRLQRYPRKRRRGWLIGSVSGPKEYLVGNQFYGGHRVHCPAALCRVTGVGVTQRCGVNAWINRLRPAQRAR
jgi:hypothetical protein